MALFNRQEELPIQKRQRQYKATTGWRKTGMDILDNPITSTFTPAVSHFGKELLAQDDDQDALKQNRGRAITNQLAGVKFASNFMPGIGPVARQVLGGVENIANGSGDEVDMTDVTNELKNQIGQEDAMNNLMNIDDEEDVSDILEEDYTSGFDDSSSDGVKGSDKISNAMDGGDNASNISNVMGNVQKGLDVVGDLSLVIQGKKAYDKELKSDKKKIFSKELDNSYYMT
jgi:hypothetical protein